MAVVAAASSSASASQSSRSWRVPRPVGSSPGTLAPAALGDGRMDVLDCAGAAAAERFMEVNAVPSWPRVSRDAFTPDLADAASWCTQDACPHEKAVRSGPP